MDLHKEQRVETLSQQSALVPERGRDILAVLYVLLRSWQRAGWGGGDGAGGVQCTGAAGPAWGTQPCCLCYKSCWWCVGALKDFSAEEPPAPQS